MSSFVVVGGGLSGLAAAWKLRGLVGSEHEILVLEAAPRLGGKLSSFQSEGWLVEEGPSAFLMRGGPLDELIEGLGLQGEIVRPASRRRLLFHNGRIREVSANPAAMVARGLLSASGAARMCLEPFVRTSAGGEESIYDFSRRRFGEGVAQNLVSPMVLGISAGDARELSVDAVFPEWALMEREHGSMVRAAFARPSGSVRMVGLKSGSESLVAALAQSECFNIQTATAVTDIESTPDGVVLSLGDGTTHSATGVIVALSPGAAGGLFRKQPALCESLSQIQEPPVSVVAVGFDANRAGTVPDAFGILIPRGQGIRSLGVVFESALFEGRAPKGQILLKVILGGGVDPEIEQLSDESLRALVLSELETILGWGAEPSFVHIRRWAEAIPQGLLGHRERRARIEAALSGLPGVELAGTGVWGIGVEKAVSSGFAAAQRLVA